MAKARQPHLVLTLVFLAILFAPGAVQLAIELRRGEHLQALEVFTAKPTSANLRAYEKALEDASWIEQQLRPVMQFAQFHLLHDAGDKALVGRDGWFFYRPGVEYVTRRPLPGALSKTGSDPLPAILMFRDQLASRGIRLLLLPMPNKESVYPEKLSVSAPANASVVCPETRRLLDRLQAAGVDVIDMFDWFARAKAARGSAKALYLAQDSHWSPAGVRGSARFVADWLVDHGWIQRGAADLRSSPVRVEKLGDVLRMLQSTLIERSIPPEIIMCEQVVPGSSGHLPDVTDSEVLVLGDSFLRIFQNDEPGSAGFIAHLARELGQPVASLVSDGGASTLVRQELHRRPGLLIRKKVVIWEFVERDIRFGAEGWQLIPVPGVAKAP